MPLILFYHCYQYDDDNDDDDDGDDDDDDDDDDDGISREGDHSHECQAKKRLPKGSLSTFKNISEKSGCPTEDTSFVGTLEIVVS